jgi:hypothetical protein
MDRCLQPYLFVYLLTYLFIFWAKLVSSDVPVNTKHSDVPVNTKHSDVPVNTKHSDV